MERLRHAAFVFKDNGFNQAPALICQDLSGWCTHTGYTGKTAEPRPPQGTAACVCVLMFFF